MNQCMQRGLFEIPQMCSFMCLFAGSKYLNYKYRMPLSTFGAFYNHIKFTDWILDWISLLSFTVCPEIFDILHTFKHHYLLKYLHMPFHSHDHTATNHMLYLAFSFASKYCSFCTKYRGRRKSFWPSDV